MSGIYIKGMEMPQDGELLCININPDGKVCIDLDLKCKRIATAIPVPDHGRLIDADALRQDWLENGENEYVYDTNSFLASLDDAPTIIPASEGCE